MFIEIECSRCSVSDYCPKKGSSPISHGKNILKCRIMGGFGRKPVDKSILSDESLKLFEKNGPCLTIAEVPSVDDQGFVTYKVEKIFSPPCLSSRETNVAVTSSDVTQRSHN